MTFFKSSDEVSSYIGKMFEDAVKIPDFKKATESSGLVLRLNYSDPDTVILVNFPEQAVRYGDDAASATDATVDIYMSCDDGHRFWLGKLNFPAALARKQLRMEGSTAKAIKLLPLTKPLFAVYEKMLTDKGRTDLLELA